MILLEVKEEAVIKLMDNILRRGGNLARPLNIIGEKLITSIKYNFETGGRFQTAGSVRGGSNRWEDLRPATREMREKINKWPGKILKVSGKLQQSITPRLTNDGNTLSVGSNRIYAAIHQFGGQAGPGRKVTIPARPYLVVQDEDIEDIIDTLTDYLLEE